MKRALIAIVIGACVLYLLALLNNQRKTPYLRTWELGTTPKGLDHLDIMFRTPERDCQPSYWSYKIGLVLPDAQDFDIRGRVIVRSERKRKTTILEFNSETVTRSSWLQDPVRRSYLLLDDFGMKDDDDYQMEIHFDEPLTTDVGVVLHFLSRTDPKQIEANRVDRSENQPQSKSKEFTR